jgi:hypothetical protein
MSADNEQMTQTMQDQIRKVLAEMLQEELAERLPPRAVLEVQKPTGPEQRILDALYWLEQTTSKEAFPPSLVAFFSRHQQETPSFLACRRELRKNRWTEHTYAGYMQLTERGRKLATPQMAIPRKDPVPVQ